MSEIVFLVEQVRDAIRCHFDEGQGPAVTRLGDEIERCPRFRN